MDLDKPNQSVQGQGDDLENEKLAEDKESFDFDKVLDEVGAFGRFQAIMCLLIFIPAGLTGSTALGNVFLAAQPAHRCEIPQCDSTKDPDYDLAFDRGGFAEFTIPREDDSENFQSCSMFQAFEGNFTCDPASFSQTKIVDCDLHVYDDTFYEETVVTEFDLNCKDQWKGPLIQSVFFAGVLLATIVFGQLATTFGRKPSLIGSVFLMTVAPLISSFSVSYEMYVIFQFITAFGQCGVFQISFILSVEIVGAKYRVLPSILIEYFFVLGELLLTLLAFWLRRWRSINQAISVACFISLICSFILPESPRWLLRKSKFKEAEKEITRIAKWNKKTWDKLSSRHIFDEEDDDESDVEEESIGADETFFDIFKTRNLALRTLNLYFAWMVVSLSFYALSLSSTSLAGNPYLNFGLVALAEIPGYTMSYIGLEKLGRRFSMASSLILGGIACLIGSFETTSGISLAAFLLGKMCITSAFATVFLFTSELYPTSIRAIGLGVCSMMGRVGAIVSPYIGMASNIVDWLPLMIISCMALMSGILVLLLPETRGKRLPDTIAEVKRLQREKRKAKKNHI